MFAPPAGEAEVKVMVPVDDPPGTMVEGLKANDLMPMTVKGVALDAVPLGVVTEIAPVEPPTGTTAVILLADTTVKVAAGLPWKLTAVAPVSVVPVMVTVVPVGPLDGVNEVIWGVTVKANAVVPPGSVTSNCPDTAPTGTTAVILVEETMVNVACTALKVTAVT